VTDVGNPSYRTACSNGVKRGGALAGSWDANGQQLPTKVLSVGRSVRSFARGAL